MFSIIRKHYYKWKLKRAAVFGARGFNPIEVQMIVDHLTVPGMFRTFNDVDYTQQIKNKLHPTAGLVEISIIRFIDVRKYD